MLEQTEHLAEIVLKKKLFRKLFPVDRYTFPPSCTKVYSVDMELPTHFYSYSTFKSLQNIDAIMKYVFFFDTLDNDYNFWYFFFAFNEFLREPFQCPMTILYHR